MRTGGLFAIMQRICTGEVCVRRRRSSVSQRVSDWSIDGWWGAVLSAVKLLNFVSMSGPSATVKPMRAKMRATSAMTLESGWTAPRAGQRPGSEQSKAGPAAEAEEANEAARSVIAASRAWRQAFTALPKAARSSGGTSLICFVRAGRMPLRPRYLMRACSSAAASAAALTASIDSECSF